MNTDFWKIREMYLSGDKEDVSIAEQWLIKEIGPEDAAVNLLILLLHKDWDDDSDIIVDENNFFKMKFNTYPISFGRDYRYRVCRVAKVKGEEILNDDQDYSRWQVGNGEPKWDFCQRLCDIFRERGRTFYAGLFHKLNRDMQPNGASQPKPNSKENDDKQIKK